jgi:trehalose 6-phosphate phosphatase
MMRPTEKKSGRLGPALQFDQECCLFLDLDGTVLDIAATPGAAKAAPHLIETLRDLDHLLGGALAIVSGRTVASIDVLLAPLRLKAVGVHGCEVRARSDGGVVRTRSVVPGEMLIGLKAELAGLEGVCIEDKGCSVAIHYRGAPEAEPVVRRLIGKLPLAECDLQVIPGRKVFEICPDGHSKRAAIARLQLLAPFYGRRPVVIGDDVTDEAAIDAVKAWGGRGLRVAGEYFSSARSDFAGPADVRAWLSKQVAIMQSTDRGAVTAASQLS